MTSASKNYIPAELATKATTWLLPDIGHGDPIPSAEKEAREREERAAAAAKEVVEDVEPLALPTADEIEAVFEAARQDGYQAGYQAGLVEGQTKGEQRGHEQAYANAQEEIQRLQAQLGALIEKFEPPADSQLLSLQQLIVQIVRRLTQKLVMTELTTPTPHIENLVQACLGLLPSLSPQAKPVVTLHPDDLAYLHGESMISDIMSRCDWVGDETLAPGGCKVDTPSSHLDARLEARMNDVLDAFEQGQLGSHEAGEPQDRNEDGAVDAAENNAASDSSGSLQPEMSSQATEPQRPNPEAARRHSTENPTATDGEPSPIESPQGPDDVD